MNRQDIEVLIDALTQQKIQKEYEVTVIEDELDRLNTEKSKD